MPLLSAKNLRDGRVVVGEDEAWISTHDYVEITRSRRFAPGSVLLGVIGGSIGNVARLALGDPLAFQRSVAALSPGPLLDGEYLWHVSRSCDFREQLFQFANISAQAGVYLGDLGSVLVPLPSLEDQERVACALQKEGARTDRLTACLRHQLNLLGEHRQALITAAVTGEYATLGAA